jgi:hypothetical protein
MPVAVRQLVTAKPALLLAVAITAPQRFAQSLSVIGCASPGQLPVMQGIQFCAPSAVGTPGAGTVQADIACRALVELSLLTFR